MRNPFRLKKFEDKLVTCILEFFHSCITMIRRICALQTLLCPNVRNISTSYLYKPNKAITLHVYKTRFKYKNLYRKSWSNPTFPKLLTALILKGPGIFTVFQVGAPTSNYKYACNF